MAANTSIISKSVSSLPTKYLLVLLISTLSFLSSPALPSSGGGCCIDSERRALLSIKQGIYQLPHKSWLSSWSSDDCHCCTWRGVGCDNATGHVVKLDLSYPIPYVPLPYPSKLLDSSLVGLTHLRHLDLSMNNFDGCKIPQSICSLLKLEYLNLSYARLSGIVPPQLGNLSNLHFLDLSYNDGLTTGNDLDWLSQMTSLHYLDMSFMNFSLTNDNWFYAINKIASLSVLKLSWAYLDKIPNTPLPHFNLTSLTVLDLSDNHFHCVFPHWLYNISTLVHLNLGGNFFEDVQWLHVLENNKKLAYVDLSFNTISPTIIPETVSNFTNLVYLDLSATGIRGELPETLGNLYNLQMISLAANSISGELPETFGNLYNLQMIDLDMNNIRGELPKTLGNLYNLQMISLATNSISGELPETLGNLYNLHMIDLAMNNISGELPKTLGSLCKLNTLDLSYNQIGGGITSLLEEFSKCSKRSNLQDLILSGNKLSGFIPTTLNQLSNLVTLDLSDNSFMGNLTETYFTDLTNLQSLCLSFNSFEIMFSQGWVPPFNAQSILMASCLVGPKFPAWLQTQTQLDQLDLSSAGISDTIPSWFWDLDIQYLNLSQNQIKGKIPPSTERIYRTIDLSSNNFSGHIPNFSPAIIEYIDLSNNSFSGPLPLSLATANYIVYFSFSNNYLCGSIPPTYFYKMFSLQVVDLSHNNLNGRLPLFTTNNSWIKVIDLSNNKFSNYIPESFGHLEDLKSLHLRKNSLNGTIPRSLARCKDLVVLDASENSLSGNIPRWIGESFPHMAVLSLRSNFFNGSIPTEISYLPHLQVLDLACNNLSGVLPRSFGNLSSMEEMLNVNKSVISSSSYYEENVIITAKGLELVYTRTLSVMICIDISCNNLQGDIPEELTKLHGLDFLNLSNNHFTGKIPVNIGSMQQLQSLDLSINNISGSIPASISNLYFLSRLNLSHNNLSGSIPTGDQLQTLNDPSIYNGNLDLCGFPLPQCSVDVHVHAEDKEDVADDEVDTLWFYAITILGFVTGFWCFIGILLIKPSLRFLYFGYIDNLCDWIFEKQALAISKFKTFW